VLELGKGVRTVLSALVAEEEKTKPTLAILKNGTPTRPSAVPYGNHLKVRSGLIETFSKKA
jgi:hypothetical protein